jgi:hypothetical protein
VIDPHPRARAAPPDPNVWRVPLHAGLRGRALPLVWTPETLVPASTLWSGARQWVRSLRAAGLTPGDRVVCALAPGPAFVMLLVASLWEELTFVPVPVAADLDRLTSELHPALVVAERPAVGVTRVPDAAGAPPEALTRAGDAAEPTRDARFLLQTSGTAGAPRWIALSDANVHAVLASHRPHLGLGGAVLLSVLPWHHAFGLVLELLPALLDGAELLRVPTGGRDVNALLAVAASHPVTHLNTVPRAARTGTPAPGHTRGPASASRCASVSTPSATVCSPSARASCTTVRTSAAACGSASPASPSTKLLSILSTRSG